MRTLSLLAFVAASQGLTILPLGDSITKGCGSDAGPSNNWTAVCGPDSGGYRAPLWASLTAAGFNVTFVGTQSSGPAWLPATGQHHEGHPGWRIDQILQILPTWAALKPDVILLLLGTNDIGQGHPLAEVASNLTTLLNATVAALPAARIVVGTVLNMVNSANPQWEATVTALNGQIPALAARFGATVADLAAVSGLCNADTSPLRRLCAECNGPASGCEPPGSFDRIHPTAAGYDLLAGAWAGVLGPLLQGL